MTSATVLEMPRSPPPVEDTEKGWPKALLGNEGRRECSVRTRIYDTSAFTRGHYQSTNTYNLRSSAVTSEYAGFRTLIAMLRILGPIQLRVTTTFFSRSSLTRTRVEITQTGELNSSYHRSA